MDLEPEEMAETIREMTIVGRVLSPCELQQACRVSSALQQHLAVAAGALCLEQPERPVMFAYLCDGWTCIHSGRENQTALPDLEVHRQTWQFTEFLLERGLVRIAAAGGGGRNLAMVMAPLAAWRRGEQHGMSSQEPCLRHFRARHEGDQNSLCHSFRAGFQIVRG